jgi:hypothetical protein
MSKNKNKSLIKPTENNHSEFGNNLYGFSFPITALIPYGVYADYVDGVEKEKNTVDVDYVDVTNDLKLLS